MISNITSARAGEAEGLLFDSWFDPIEVGLRAKVRGFIETMIEEELTTVLSRPRYGRRHDGKEAAVGVVGYRHGRRMRRLTGTFGSTGIVGPRAPPVGAGGGRRGGGGVAGPPAPDVGCRFLDRLDVFGRTQHAAGAPGARGRVRRRHRQGRGQPSVAEGEDGLGGLERPLSA